MEFGKNRKKSQAISILGTGSDVGKSLVTAGLCRLLWRAGFRVAPFKAQNMALNSFVTPEGGEMGRAQVLQAQACYLQPHVDMNPILLKPEADNQSQVIVRGKVWRTHGAREYFEKKSELMKIVKESYDRLAEGYDLIVIEGAGSAAEMNLRDRDIVNWPVVEMADASVILVADIDRGGVFAQVIGTLDLLSAQERRRVIGVVINKFRGDATLFEDGVKMIEERAGVPVLGVLPYLKELELDQEDSVVVDRYALTPFCSDAVNVAVLLLPHMSNFTDFNPLAAESDVALRYVRHPQELDGADVVIVPGSKTTMADLDYLKKEGFTDALTNTIGHRVEIIGICGGFQMLGGRITDPHGMEGGRVSRGFGLLELTTELLPEKTTTQVTACPIHFNFQGECIVEGYEIHMGVTTSHHHRSCFQITSGNDGQYDGYMRNDGLVWGTYIHGVFDQPGFRRRWLNRIRVRKHLQEVDVTISESVSQRLSQEIDRWADHVHQFLNLNPIVSSLQRKKPFDSPKASIEKG